MNTKKISILFCCMFTLCALVMPAMAVEKDAAKNGKGRTIPLGAAKQNVGAVKIFSESSGILWKRDVFGPDGKTPTEIHYGYRDGYRGVFYLSTLGRVKMVHSYYPKNEKDGDKEKLHFEVVYLTDTTQVQKWQLRRENGSLAETFERLPDAVEVKTQFRDTAKTPLADGTLPDIIESQVTTNPDGSQTSIKFAEDGKLEIAKEVIEAKPNEVSYVPFEDPERLPYTVKVRRIGVKILDWDYTYPDGTIAHQGKFDKDGGIVFTVFNAAGKLTHKHHWKLMSEDHLRKYYKINLIEEYDIDTSVLRSEVLFDEKTQVIELVNVYNKDTKLQERQIVWSEKDGVYLMLGFDQEGNRNGQVSPIYAGTINQSFSLFLQRPNKTLEVPGSDNLGGEIYRLMNTPFTTKKLEGESFLDPLFVK